MTGSIGRSLKERAITGILNTIVSITNRKLNVGELQERHSAHSGRLMRVNVRDIQKAFHFRVADGRLEFVDDPGKSGIEVVGGIDIGSDAVIGLALGRKRYMNPATGETFDQAYTPMDAIANGHVSYWGEAASNDLLLFARAVYSEVFPRVREELAPAASASTSMGANGGPHA